MKLTNTTDSTPINNLYVFTGKLKREEKQILVLIYERHRDKIKRVLGRHLYTSIYVGIEYDLYLSLQRNIRGTVK